MRLRIAAAATIVLGAVVVLVVVLWSTRQFPAASHVTAESSTVESQPLPAKASDDQNPASILPVDADLKRTQGQKLKGTLKQATVLTGCVKNGYGAPIAEATVSSRDVRSMKLVEVRVRSDGGFSVPDLAVGRTYEITGAAARYAPSQLEIAVPEDGDLAPCTIVLEKGGSVSGIVVDTRGRKVPACRVRAERETRNAKPWPYCEAEADASGRFAFDGDLVPDSYVFSVWSGRSSYQKATHPPVTLDKGQVLTDLKLVITAPEDGRICGYVRAEDGKGIPRVHVRAANDVCSSRTMTDVTGRYALEGLAGETVDVDYQDGEFERGPAKLEDVALGTTGLDVVLYRYGTVSGVVVSEKTGEEIPEFEIEAYVEDRYGNAVKRCPERRRKIDGGSFLITKVDSGLVTLEVKTKNHPTYEATGIGVGPGQDVTGIVVRLPEPATMTGHIFLNGTRVNKRTGMVEAVNLDTGKSTGWCGVNDEGVYRLTHLQAGEHHVRAMVRLGDGPGCKAIRVTRARVLAGETTHLNLTVDGTGTVCGAVSAPAEYPRIRVFLRSPSARGPLSFENRPPPECDVLGYTGCQSPVGRYQIDLVPPGTYEVVAACARPLDEGQAEEDAPVEIRSISRTISISGGQTIELDFAL